MSKQEKQPDWLLWLWERGFVLGSLIALVLLVGVLGLVYYVDQRLEGLEDRLAYDPPRRYESPKLDAPGAVDVAPESLAVNGAMYVPVYSHVYYDQGRPFLLETTLSIRNTDVSRPIYAKSVCYYDTKGELVKTHLDRLTRLGPLETIEFLVEARDTTGGSGANFIVHWCAAEEVDEPIVEAVMVGIVGPQGICLSSRGHPITPPSSSGKK